MSQLPPIEDRSSVAASLDGVVERVVYADHESAWSVVRLRVPNRRDTVAAVGRLLGVQPGDELRLSGEWARNRKYGEQFRVSSYLVHHPNTLKGIERYLGSGRISGIGKVMARRLVAAFGLTTLQVIDIVPMGTTVGTTNSVIFSVTLLQYRDEQLNLDAPAVAHADREPGQPRAIGQTHGAPELGLGPFADQLDLGGSAGQLLGAAGGVAARGQVHADVLRPVGPGGRLVGPHRQAQVQVLAPLGRGKHPQGKGHG